MGCLARPRSDVGARLNALWGTRSGCGHAMRSRAVGLRAHLGALSLHGGACPLSLSDHVCGEWRCVRLCFVRLCLGQQLCTRYSIGPPGAPVETRRGNARPSRCVLTWPSTAALAPRARARWNVKRKIRASRTAGKRALPTAGQKSGPTAGEKVLFARGRHEVLGPPRGLTWH